MFAMHNNTNAPLLKGSANLNWILQILHYYGKKQHKKIENSQFIEQNVVISNSPSLCLLQLVLHSPSPTREFLKLWTQYFAELGKHFKLHKWSF